MKIKLGYNVSTLTSGHKVRGVGTYAKSLLEELQKNPELEVHTFTNYLELPPGIDLIHDPFFGLFQRTLSRSEARKYPTVVTVHDVIPLRFPKHYPPGIKGKFNLQMQKIVLRSVKKVITESEFCREGIHKHLGVPEERIAKIPLAATGFYKQVSDKSKLSQVIKKFNLPDKFGLFIGSVNWNKNLSNMAEAAIRADLDFVLVGKSFETRENLDHPELQPFKEFLEKYANHPKIHILGFVESEDLLLLLNAATMLLFVSHCEGFGLPILEAQACGLPVITGKFGSMPEVAGDSALYADSNSVQEITEQIKLLLENKKLRDELIKKGFENNKKYSWENTAKKTFEVYKQILNK